MTNHKRVRYWIIIILTTLTSIILTKVVSSSLLGDQVFSFASEPFENNISDFYTMVARKTSRNRKASDDVCILYIDQAKNRKEIASMINKVISCEPRVIGLDVRFDLAGGPEDQRLVNIIKENQERFVLTVTGKRTPERESCVFSDISTSFFMNQLDKTVVGFDNLITSSGNPVIRDLLLTSTFKGKELPSFANSVSCLYNHNSLSDESRYKLFYYPTYFHPISDSSEILDHKSIIRDKVVLIGARDEIDDQHFTPIGALPGVDIHAQAVQGLIDGNKVSIIPNWIVILISVITAILFSSFLLYCKLFLSDIDNLLARLIQLALLVLLLAIGAFLFAYFDIYFNFTPIMGVIVLGSFSFDIIFGLSSLIKH